MLQDAVAVEFDCDCGDYGADGYHYLNYMSVQKVVVISQGEGQRLGEDQLVQLVLMSLASEGQTYGSLEVALLHCQAVGPWAVEEKAQAAQAAQ